MPDRSFVPFGELWSMRIDVPYSFLVVDDGHAWSCGQLALDDRGEVLAPGDLIAQARTVAANLETILQRAGLARDEIGRLALYHGPSTDEVLDAALAVFTRAFPGCLLTPIEVPHFYYDGVELEVDLFGGRSQVRWHSSVERDPPHLGLHHLVPPGERGDVASTLPDPGAAIVAAGSGGERTYGFEVVGHAPTTTVTDDDGVKTVVRQAGRFTWTQARVTDHIGHRGLVAQTEAVMAAMDDLLVRHGLAYGEVVKSTTHYVGGSSPDELHDNMAVRNRRYRSPGPASTGVPVARFADPNSLVVVDLTLTR